MDKKITTLRQRFTTPSHDTVQSHRQCGICWTEYSDDNQAVKLPCGHVFGEECILAWAKGSNPTGCHNGCLTCRAELLTPSLQSIAAALARWLKGFCQAIYALVGGGCVE